jgi:hypothetical protein
VPTTTAAAGMSAVYSSAAPGIITREVYVGAPAAR